MRQWIKNISYVIIFCIAFELFTPIDFNGIADARDVVNMHQDGNSEKNIYDRMAPTEPKNLRTIDVTESSISIAWDGSFDEGGIKGYEIILDGNIYGIVENITKAVIPNLQPNTSYNIAVRAIDNCGNISCKSNTITEKTKEIKESDLTSLESLDYLQPTESNLNENTRTLTLDELRKLLGLDNYEAPSNVEEPTTEEVKNEVNLKCNTKTDKTITLEWSITGSIDGFDRYEIYRGKNKIGTTNITNYVVDGLDPDCAYTFIVKAVDKDGNELLQSNQLTITTDKDDKKPNTPKNLSIMSKTERSLVLLWEAATDNIEVVGYDIFDGDKKIGETKGTTTFTITDLKEGQEFNFKVRARDAAKNESDFSNIVKYTFSNNEKTEEIPTSPTNLEIKNVEDTMLTLSWSDADNGKGTLVYDIYSNNKKVASTNATSYKLEGLKPNTNYTFYVIARTLDNKQSSKSVSVQATTKKDEQSPSSPMFLSILEKNGSVVKLHWQPSTDNSGEVSYIIYNNDVKIGNCKDTTFTFDTSNSTTNCNFKVVAIDASGNESPSSNVVEYKIETSNSNVKSVKSRQQQVKSQEQEKDLLPPEKPTNLQVSFFDKHKAVVTWDRSYDNVGVVAYDVFWNDVKVGSCKGEVFIITCLPYRGSGYIKVQARDAANLCSEKQSVEVKLGDFIVGSNKETATYLKEFSTITTSAIDYNGTQMVDCYEFIPSGNNLYSIVTLGRIKSNSIIIKDEDGKQIDCQCICDKTSYSSEINYVNVNLIKGKKYYIYVNPIEKSSYSIRAVYKNTEINKVDYVIQEGSSTIILKSTNKEIQCVFYEIWEDGQLIENTFEESISKDYIKYYSVKNNDNKKHEYVIKARFITENEAKVIGEITIDNTKEVSTEVVESPSKNALSKNTNTISSEVSNDIVIDKNGEKLNLDTWYTFTQNKEENNKCYVLEPTKTGMYRLVSRSNNKFISIYNENNEKISNYNNCLVYAKLEAGKKYYITVGEAKAAYQYDFKFIGTFTSMDKLQKPQNLKATSITESKVTLSWENDIDNNKVMYFIIYRNGKELTQLAGYATSYTDSQLMPSTTYKYKVVAVDEFGGKSDVSEEIVPVTKDDITAPSNIWISSTQTGYNKILLTWSKPTNDVIDHYEIYDGDVKIASTNETSFLFSSANPGQTYKFWLKVIDVKGNACKKGYITEVKIQDDYKDTIEDAKEVDINSIISGKINYKNDMDVFTFNVSEEGIYGFSCYGSSYKYGVLYDSNGKELSGNGRQTLQSNFLIKCKLKAGKYYLKIGQDRSYSVDRNGEDYYIIIQKFENKKPTNIKNVTVSDVTKNSFVVNWDDSSIDKNALYYKVYIGKKVDGNIEYKYYRVTRGNNQYKVTSLNIGTDYYVKVSVVDVLGNESDYSEEVIITTIGDKEPPTKPENLEVYEVNAWNIKLRYDYSTDDIGVKYYLITITDGNEYYKELTDTSYYTYIYNLKPDTIYTITVQAVDTSGNKSEAASITVKTLYDDYPDSISDATGIEIDKLIKGTSTGKEGYYGDYDYMKFNTTKAGVYKIKYSGKASVEIKVYDNYKNRIYEADSEDILIELAANTTYYISVQRKSNSSSDEYEFTVISPEEAGKTPTNLIVKENNVWSAKVQWTASIDESGIDGYEVYLNEEYYGYSKETSIKLDVNSGTNYIVKVRAKNVKGEYSEFAEISFKTLVDDYRNDYTNVYEIKKDNKENFETINGKINYVDDVDVFCFIPSLTAVYNLKITGNYLSTYVYNEDFNSLSYYSGLRVTAGKKYYIRVKAYSGYSNVSYSIVITPPDIQAPTAPVINKNANTTLVTAKISWSASTDNVGVTKYLIYRDGVKIKEVSSTTLTYNDTNLKAGTTYKYYIVAQDSAGNYSDKSEEIAVTTVPDTTNPTAIKDLKLVEVTASSIKISWKASTDNWGIDRYEIIWNDVNSGAIGTNEYTIEGLQANTLYNIIVVAIDKAGLKSLKESIEVRTLKDDYENDMTKASTNVKELERIAGNIDYKLDEDYFYFIPEKDAKYILSLSLPIGSCVLVYDDAGNIKAYNEAKNSTVLKCVVDLEKDKKYYVAIKDSSSNLGAYNFVITQYESEKPSTPGNLKQSENTCTSIKITWTGSTDNIGVEEYVIYRNGQEIARVSGDIRSYIDTNLESNKEYKYYVVAKDVCDNYSDKSVEVSCATLEDKEAPEKVDSIEVVSKTATSIKIKWNIPNDNVLVTGYVVYRDGQAIATVYTNSYEDINLETNKAYKYSIVAFDEKGNKSALGKVLQVSLQKPHIIGSNPGELGEIGGNQKAEIKVSISNEKNIENSYAKFEYSSDNVKWNLIADKVSVFSYDSDKITFKYDWNIANISDGKYYIRYTVYDAVGESDSIICEINIDKIAPTAPTNVTAESGIEKISIAWSASPEANVKYYDVYRAESLNGTYTLVARISDLQHLGYTDRDLVVGKYYYYKIYAIDKFDQKSSASKAVNSKAIVDDEKPVIIEFTPNDNTIFGKKAKLRVKATDNIKLASVKLSYSINNGVNWIDIGEINTSAYADFVWYTGDLAGDVLIKAVAKDASNNVSDEVIRKYAIDKVAPKNVSDITTVEYASQILLKWKYDIENDFSYFKVEIKNEDGNYEELGKVYSKLGYQVANLDNDTTYSFRITTCDKYDNESEGVIVTTKTKVDTNAPIIKDLSRASKPYSTVIPLYASVCDNSDVREVTFEYSLDLTNWTKIGTVTYYTPQYNVTAQYNFDVTNLADGYYYIRAVAKDGSNNTSPTDKNASYTCYVVDHTPPTVPSNVVVNNENGNLTLSWDENKEAQYFNIYRSNSQDGHYELLINKLASLFYNDRDAEVGKKYYYKVSAIDFAGNESKLSEAIVGQRVEDKIKPEIISVLPSDNDTIGHNPEFSILAADNYDLSMIYGEYELNGKWIRFDSKAIEGYSNVESLKWDTTNLKSGKYRVKFVAVDKNNNESDEYIVSYNCEFVTLEKVKVELEPFGWSIKLSWDGKVNSNRDVAYRIYRSITTQNDYKLIKETTECEYLDAVLDPGKTYYYRVDTLDEYGNISQSDEVMGTPLNIDIYAPVAKAGNDIATRVGENVTFDASASTDNVGITKYLWDFGDGYKSENKISVSHSYAKAGIYTATLVVWDAHNNVSTDTIKVTVYDKNYVSGITVTVVDSSTNATLEDAFVYVAIDENDNSIYKTNSKGIAQLVSKSGKQKISAYKEGYLPADTYISVDKNQGAQVVIKLRKSDVVAGKIEVHRMTLDEIKEAGIDVTNPENQFVFNFTLHLEFSAEHIPVTVIGGQIYDPVRKTKTDRWKVVNSTKKGNGKSSGGGKYACVVNKGGKSVAPTIAILDISESVTWLKEFFEVNLLVENLAKPEYVITDSTAELKLPNGLSLAPTKSGQSFKVGLGDIKGGQQKKATWIIRGDIEGNYDLEAEFNGTLQPFNSKINKSFKTESEIKVWGGDALKLYIKVENFAYVGEKYYVQFVLVNQSNIPVYNIATTFGDFSLPTPVSKVIVKYPDGRESVETTVGLAELPNFEFFEKAVDCLLPGQFIMGTYVTSLPEPDVPEGEDPEHYRWKLLENRMIFSCSGSNVNIETSINIVPSHVNVRMFTFDTSGVYWADPVDTSTGGFEIENSLLQLQGKVPLSFELKYNSASIDIARQISRETYNELEKFQKAFLAGEYSGKQYASFVSQILNTRDLGKTTLGTGWSSNFDIKMSKNYDGTITVYWSPYNYTVFYPNGNTTPTTTGMIGEDGRLIVRDEETDATEFYPNSSLMKGLVLRKNGNGNYTLSMTGREQYEFDGNGQLIKMVDSNGYFINLTRTDKELIIKDSVTNQQLTIAYNSRGLVDYVQDSHGRTVVFKYDVFGNLNTVINCDGTMYVYEYDNKGYLTAAKVGKASLDGLVNVREYVKNTYDSKGRVLTQDDGIDSNKYTKFKYSETEKGYKTTTITDRNGNERINYFDSQGNLIKVKDELNHIKEMTYDEEGNKLTEKDELGNVISYKYIKGEFVITLNNKVEKDGQLVSGEIVGGKIKDSNTTIDTNKDIVIDGTIVIQEDQEHIVKTQFIDKIGNIICMQDSYDNKFINLYDGRNLLRQTLTLLGARKEYKYDENAMLIEEKTISINNGVKEEKTTSYEYKNGLLVATIDYNKNKSTFEYDEFGRVIKVTTPGDEVTESYTTEYEYDIVGNKVLEKTALGGIKKYKYNCFGKLISETDERGNETRYEYNGNYLLSKVIDAKGNETIYEYDGEDRLIIATDAKGNTVQNKYDEAGRVIEKIDSNGNVTKFKYTDKNELEEEITQEGYVTKYTYYKNGKLKSKCNANNAEITYYYDAAGKLIKVSNPILENQVNDDKKKEESYIGDKDASEQYKKDNKLYENSTTYKYDAAGNVIEESDAYCNKTKYDYDAEGRLIRKTDARGNKIEYTYDLNGNAITMTIFRTVEEVVNGKKVNKVQKDITKYSYDIQNRVIKVTNPRGYAQTFTYNANNQVTCITNELGHKQYMEYDVSGNLICVKDAYGNIVSKNEYDELNRQVKSSDALSNTVVSKYDEVGNLIELIDAMNQSSKYEYDANGQMVKSTVANEDGTGTKKSSAKYDSVGNLLTIVDNNGNKTSYEYNLIGGIKAECLPFGNRREYEYNNFNLVSKFKNGRGQETEYLYDKLGRVISITDNVGTITYTYDENGNITKITEKTSNSTKTITREFDELNRVKKYTDANGKMVQYSYDSIGNLIALTYPGGEIVRYSYDAANNLKTVTDWQNRKTVYEYDKNERLKKTIRPNGTVEEITYDIAGRVIKKVDTDADGYEITKYEYTYDANGRLISEKQSQIELGNGLKSDTMTYGEGNRLLTYNGIKIEYDADGNMIKGILNGKLVDFVFDCRNRLIKAGNTEYEYDAEDNRIAVIENGVKTSFVYNTNASLSQMLYMFDSSNNGSYFVYGKGLIGEQIINGEYLVYHFDNRGSTVAITDMDGVVTDRFTYGPYGELINHDGDSHIIFLYNGRDGVVTDANGLYYMRARYYNPELKRFINADILLGSISDSSTLNRYAYVSGDPVSLVDPFGLSPDINTSTIGHTILDFLGMIPGIGCVFDFANMIWYIAEGNWLEAAFCFLGALPVFGYIAAGAKWGINAFKATKFAAKVTDVCSNIGKWVSKGEDFFKLAYKFYREDRSVYLGMNAGGELKKMGKALGKAKDTLKEASKVTEGVADAVEWTNHGFKHFPQKNMSWKDIIKSTKNGPAKYISGTDIEALERMVWEKGTTVTNGKTWKVMEFDDVIGASAGVETKYMRVEMSGGTIHGHPITKTEYKKLIK